MFFNVANQMSCICTKMDISCIISSKKNVSFFCWIKFEKC